MTHQTIPKAVAWMTIRLRTLRAIFQRRLTVVR
jgi:hypothetical protein